MIRIIKTTALTKNANLRKATCSFVMEIQKCTEVSVKKGYSQIANISFPNDKLNKLNHLSSKDVFSICNSSRVVYIT